LAIGYALHNAQTSTTLMYKCTCVGI